ncbi:hypothetical protein BAGA_20345 [Bacillus gaemokensis]|uniref:DUF11 domain-containing protein n=1 Tax=Bacillus gaemokensis TaxID=574375 RepID=A0A073K4K2_9BACI|nr:DUF11 domain-containing protein [Bacillus gaemokensis]KEK22244.1 hypothetical protein BAGA_20345 [Bacillus gaemokensis]KYG28776.1 hypothetical protein AZF08_13705 [Bacillus gaemokensis]
MPFMNRFTTTVPGAVTFTGNTLGLSPTSPAPNNNFGTIDVFTTINTSLQVPGFPAGTTNNWPQNSSSAILNIPAGSNILYAELVWAGTFKTDIEDVSAFLNDAVTFITPAGTFSITPDPATAQQGSVGNQFYYVRSANVTNLVSGGGTYTTGSVPAARTAANPTISRSVGWTLEVIYQNGNLPLRNLSVYAGQEIIDASSPPVDAVISGFATPATGPVTGRVLVTAQEGDSNIVGDQLRFGPTANTTVALSGPQNPANNFFQSQICNDTGNLDTTGTFGNLNQPLGTALPVRRQGWDITNVNASASLVNNQTSATVRFVTNGDGYAGAGFGVQIDATGPIINPVKAVDRTVASVGDTLTYTITVPNTGTANAENVILRDTIPNGTTFISGSVTVGGVVQPSANPAVGINLGTIPFNSTPRIVTFQVRVTSFPTPNPIPNEAMVTYQFRPFVGSPLTTSTAVSNTVQTTVNRAVLSLQKVVDLQIATINDVLTYTTSITNTGNVTANNVVFVDSIPEGTTFIAGSVTVNGIAQPGANPANSINIGSVGASQTIVVRFQVRITSSPLTNPIPNRSSATFNFTITPGGQPISGQATSNTVSTQVNVADIRVRKAVNAANATVGDILTYSIEIQNISNVNATNVFFQDTIPSGAVLIANSVTVDGVSQPGADPGVGFSIPDISPSSTRIVMFQVQITSVPSGGTVANSGRVSADFIINPNQPPVTINRQSNTVVTQINTGDLNVIKEVNITQAGIGETLTYTVMIQNTGTVTATNVLFQDTIPPGTTFVANSVTINGVSQPGANPALGFALPDIPVASTVTVQFQVTVVNVPSGGNVVNQATVTASFILNPGQPPVTTTTPSNNVSTRINTGTLNVQKVANVSEALIGDTFTYTVTIRNTGTVEATNVIFIDPIASETIFVADSVTINGVLQPGANPNLGFSLPNIPPAGTINVQFNVTVIAPSSIGIVTNEASVTGTFQLNPGQPPVTTTTPSNTTVVGIPMPSPGDIVAEKSVSATEAGVGDILTYMIVISNVGGSPVTDVFFQDTIPVGTAFVPDSVTIGGFVQPGLNPETEFLVTPLLNDGTSITVTFQVEITSIPEELVILNAGNVTFTSGDVQTVTTNAVATFINIAFVLPIKVVDREIAAVGDVLTYGIVVFNFGTVPATDVTFIDVITEGTTFIENSVEIDGVPQGGLNPFVGFSLPDIPAFDFTIVTFQVQVTSIPEGDVILNIAGITATFQVSAIGPPITETSFSNIEITNINRPGLNVVKEVDQTVVGVGDTLTYRVAIQNTGTTLATNVQFIDSLSASVEFIENSVTINDIQQIGLNPETGFQLPDIDSGSEVIVTFQVQVVSVPDGGTISNVATVNGEFTLVPGEPPVIVTSTSNTVVVTVNEAILFIAKGADFEVAMVGDVITYRIAVINDGTVLVTNVVLTDLIDPNTIFLNGTVSVNDIPVPFANPNSGIPLNDLEPNDAAIIAFQVLVVGEAANSPIRNTAVVSGIATVNPNRPPIEIESDSNTVVVPFIEPNVIITALKTADRQKATIGDVITYTTVIRNEGDVAIQNIFFQDLLNSSVRFIPGSVTINGVLRLRNPVTGFVIGDLAPSEVVTVSFQVVVERAPAGGSSYINEASIRFEVPRGSVLPPVIQMITTNEVIIPFVPTLEQICLSNLGCFEQIPCVCLPFLQQRCRK